MPESTNIRIKLRTKINDLVNDYTQFAQREIQFGDVEKSIFYRGYNNNTLYRFSPVDDDSTSIYRTWSANKLYNSILNIDDDATSGTTLWSSTKIFNELEYKAEIDDTTTSLIKTWSSSYISTELDNKSDITHTHDYADLTGLPTFTPINSILFSASGAGLPSSSSAGAPALVAEGSYEYWYSNFSALNQKLIWSFPSPADYSGAVTKISIFYEVSSGSSYTWQVTFKTIGPNGDLDNPTTPTGSVQTITGTAQGNGDLSVASLTLSSNNDLIGAENRLTHVTLELTAGPTFPVYFAGMRIDYISSIGYSY